MNILNLVGYLAPLSFPRMVRTAGLAALAMAAVLLCAHAAAASGGGAARLTGEPAHDVSPSRSAEGSRVTSETGRDRNRGGYAMKVAAPSTSAATDRAALEALYRATGGANWSNNDKWMSTDAPIDEWYGVTTDNDGRVIRLDLYSNNLKGSIPAELGNLANLISLGLDANELSGSLPPALGDLANLTRLRLYGNELSGSIPADLANLTNLEWLSLGGNELSGSIPAELGNLTNLTSLRLGDNELSGSIPATLGNLTNLTSLRLGDNGLSGTIPPELGNLTNLEWLYLGGNELSGTIPPELGNLTNLKRLHLGGNDLSGCVSAVLRYVLDSDLPRPGLPYCDASSARNVATDRAVIDRKTLEAFYRATGGEDWDNRGNWLSDAPLGFWHGVSTDSNGQVIELRLLFNELSGSIPAELGNLANLKRLYLLGNELSGSIPAELGNLTNLERLHLGHNELSGSIPAELGNLTNLAGLTLGQNDLSGSIPAELGNLTNLEGLYLGGNDLSGCVPAIFRHVQQSDLHRLNLPFCEEIAPPPPLPTKPPLPATTLNAQIDDANTVALSWPAVDGASGYELEWYDSAGTLGGVALNATTFTFPELAPGDTFFYRVAAVNAAGERGAWSNEAAVTLPPAARRPSTTATMRAKPVAEIAANRAALIALYNATGGPDWKKQTDWLSEKPVEQWYGVTASGGLVTELKLPRNGLSGEIPAELGNLAYLATLDLRENDLRGEIPAELGNLANLRQLFLGPIFGIWLERFHQFNQLSGAIPPELGNLASLTHLSLAYNRLSGEIPPELGNLSSLEWLALHDNQFSGEIPAQLGNLTSLEWLALNDNRLSGEIPEELAALPNLTSLSLSGNQFSGCTPRGFGRGHVLDDAIPNKGDTKMEQWSRVAHHNIVTMKQVMHDLDRLFLPPCGTDWAALTRFYAATGGQGWKNDSGWLKAQLSSNNSQYSYLWHGVYHTVREGLYSRVVELSLADNGLEGRIPSELGALSELTRLDLSDNGLVGRIPSDLGKLTKLTHLYLAGNRLSGCLPAALRSVQNNDLGQLELEDCP